MSLQAGSILGSYEIIAPIGAGGMGEVWRAHDPRIGREVALKVLPSDVTADPERLRRFEQEARAAGNLNHPNLVTVHELGIDGGNPFIAMELLEGETLREKLGDDAGTSPIPYRKAIEYAMQLASGLAAAHEKGIVHRDLKPENIFVTRDGRVKILDFGLAKLRDHSGQTGADDRTAQRQTDPGTVMGTAGYMSPEQVRGHEVDHRTDIFSFGTVIYEMLSGRRAFRRDSSVETMNAILREDPAEISASAQHIPPAVGRIVRRCLEKSREERFESARDLAFALEAISSSDISHDFAAAPALSRRPRAFAIGAGIVAVVAMAAAALVSYRSASRAPGPAPALVSQLTFDSGTETAPSLSPDGRTFVFVKGLPPRRQIFLQRVDGRSAISLSTSPEHDDHDPAFSPDGNQIAFRSERDGGGIFLMGATGESVRRLTSEGHNPSWSPDGTEIVFGSEELISPTSRSSLSSVSIVDLSTGAVRKIFDGDAMQPSISPNRKRLLYWGLPTTGGGQRDIYTVALDGSPGSIVPATSDSPLDWNPVWEPDGKSILFASDRGGSMNIWRLAIDEESGAPQGDPRPLGVPAMWAGRISIAANGRAIAYESSMSTQELKTGSFDPDTGNITIAEEPVISGSMRIRTAEPSPDGQRLAFTTEGREDVYVIRADGSDLRQLTNDDARDRGPSWGPDGSRIYFYSTRGGEYDVWSIRADGSGVTQHTSETAGNYPVVSPDGKRISVFDIATGNGQIFSIEDEPITQSKLIALPPLPDGSGFLPSGWSPDGTELVGATWASRETRFFIYSLADQKYEELPLDVPAYGNSWLPAVFFDRDRILLATGSEILLFDRRTGELKPAGPAGHTGFARTGRFFISSRDRLEADIWHMTVGER